jgi:hypothetical protein
MQSAPSYVFSGDVAVGASSVRISGRFQAPNRLAETIQVAGRATVDAVLVGPTTFVRDPASGAWRRTTGTGAGADPRAAFSVLLQASVVSRSGGTYQLSVPAGAAAHLVDASVPTSPAAASARLSGGGILHLEVRFPSRNPPLTMALDYSSIGVAPPVTVPPAT